MVVLFQVQPLQVSTLFFALTVLVELPALVISDLSVTPVHVSRVFPPFCQKSEVPGSRLKSRAVPTGNTEVQGLVVVLQRTVAEAVLAPATAITAVAAIAARPNILRYFICSPLFKPAEGVAELRANTSD